MSEYAIHPDQLSPMTLGPEDYFKRPLVDRLRERAKAAREEGNGTALADALHFEEAAADIEKLKADVDFWKRAFHAETRALHDQKEDAHGIIARIWSIFGNPSYDELNGRTIYDLVQNEVDWERETAAVNEQMVGVIADRNAELAAKDAENARLREELRRIAETRWDTGAAEACLCTIQLDAHAALKDQTP